MEYQTIMNLWSKWTDVTVYHNKYVTSAWKWAIN